MNVCACRAYVCMFVPVCISWHACVHVHVSMCMGVYGCTSIAALNSQSSRGPGPVSPAAVGSLGGASPALASPLHPAGPSLLAAGPRQVPSSPPSHSPDAQQTAPVLTGTKQVMSHVDVFA